MKDGRPSFPAGCVPSKLWENSPFTVSLDGRAAGSGGFPALVETLRRIRVLFIRLSDSFILRAPSLPFRPAATRFPGPCRRIPSLRLGGYFIPEHQIGSGIFHGRMRAGKGATFLFTGSNSPLQQQSRLVHQRSRQKAEQRQTCKLGQREPPGACLPLGDGDGADAGQGDEAEHHDADAL